MRWIGLESGVKCHFSNWQPVTSEVLLGLVLVSRQFNTFISDRRDEIRCTLAKKTKMNLWGGSPAWWNREIWLDLRERRRVYELWNKRQAIQKNTRIL